MFPAIEMIFYSDNNDIKRKLILLSSLSVGLFSVNAIYTIQQLKHPEHFRNSTSDTVAITDEGAENSTNKWFNINPTLIQAFLLSSLTLPIITTRNTLRQITKITKVGDKLQLDFISKSLVVDKKEVKLEGQKLFLRGNNYSLEQFNSKPLMKFLNK